MKILIILIVLIALIFIVVSIYSLLVAAGRADREEENMNAISNLYKNNLDE